jgi:hypothetical protein
MPKAKAPTPDPADRRGGMRALAATLPGVARTAIGRRGFAEGGLLTDWPAIVGADIAARSLPLKLVFAPGSAERGRARRDGVLHVRVAGPLALELQHLEPLVVERINGYFGYRAVARLKIQQGPVPSARSPDPLPVIALTPDAEAALAADVEPIQDETLRDALQRYGRALRAKPGR